MKFHDCITCWDWFKKNREEFPLQFETWKEFYTGAMETMLLADEKIGGNQMVAESGWWKKRKPYYSIWPAIVSALKRLDLGKVPPESVKLPITPILFRFAEGKRSVTYNQHECKTILVTHHTFGEDNLTLWMDWGETTRGAPVLLFRNLFLGNAKTIEESLNKPLHDTANMGLIIPEQKILECVKIAVSICLLAQTDDIVEPEVISKDLEKYNRTKDIKYVEKARRRGKIGWNIGRNLDVSPHYRRAHPALVWTGRGRKIPKIVFRKGSIVKRRSITEVPTGYLADEE
jgi:hypothetical protein